MRNLRMDAFVLVTCVRHTCNSIVISAYSRVRGSRAEYSLTCHTLYVWRLHKRAELIPVDFLFEPRSFLRNLDKRSLVRFLSSPLFYSKTRASFFLMCVRVRMYVIFAVSDSNPADTALLASSCGGSASKTFSKSSLTGTIEFTKSIEYKRHLVRAVWLSSILKRVTAKRLVFFVYFLNFKFQTFLLC